MATTWNRVSKIALKFPETELNDHIGTPAVRVKGKIFVQQSADDKNIMVIKLSKETQSKLIADNGQVYNSPPHWGKFGWTNVKYSNVNESEIADLIFESWSNVAPKSISKSYAENA